MGQKSESTEHQELIRASVKFVQILGYRNIKADLPESPLKPDNVGDYMPDISAEKDVNTQLIIEIETCESYTSDKEQIETFADSNKIFWLIVPKECSNEVNDYYNYLHNIEVHGL